MAKKASRKSKGGKKNAGKKNAGTTNQRARALTPKQIHRVMLKLFAEPSAGGEGGADLTRAMPVSAAVAAAEKLVSFTLTNIGSIGTITSGAISFGLSGGATVGQKFPVGTNDLFYGVQGPANQAFSIAVQGATLDRGINSRLTEEGKAGGSRKLTVA